MAAADNYKIDSTHYTAPAYGYAGLKYAKATDNFDRSKIPGNGPNPVVKVPAFWKSEMKNGIRVIGTENTEVPLVTVNISIPGGHITQANELSKVGLAGLFADMMNEDTKNYTAEKFSDELRRLGSTIRVNSSTDEITITLQSLKKNISRSLELLQERLFNPNFTEAAFKRIQKQSIESLRQSKSQPAYVASAVINKINYGVDNILGLDQNGTEASLNNITLQDIQSYYDKYISSKGTRMVIVGDVKQSEILPKIAFMEN
jgi:zinc protease